MSMESVYGKVPEDCKDHLDELVDSSRHETESEAVREAIRYYLSEKHSKDV
jgi:Arc/MetJ-type ribon-helix-helix transcriptional regulator